MTAPRDVKVVSRIGIDRYPNGVTYMKDDPEGDYVMYDDHARALADVEAEVVRERRGREHTEQWYAERLEPIKDIAKREGIWPEVAAVIANGSGTRQLPDGSYVYEPPTYAQQLNSAKHRAEAALKRAETAEAALAAATARGQDHD